MKIDITHLIPNEWVHKKEDKIVELFYYNKKRGNNPKAVLLSKIIEVDEAFMEGFGLFLGDADLDRKEKRHLTYASRDKDIAKKALDFLTQKFGLNTKTMSFHICYRAKNEKIVEEWASFLKIPEDKISVRFSSRHRNECVHIQVNSVIFREVFEKTVKEVRTIDFLNNPNLRTGFLRGLFAAEGSINIMWKENYIGYMGYHLSFHKERNLAILIQGCLEKEGIKSTIIDRPEKGETLVQITGWPNYWKMFNKKIISISERKNKTFLEHTKRMSFYFQISNKLKEKLLNGVSKRKIAKELNFKYITFSCEFQRNALIKYFLLRLASFRNISHDEILENIIAVKGKKTAWINDKDLARFVLDLR